MPIEIKELHIRITVNAPEGGNKPAQSSSQPQDGAFTDREAMLAECVEQVLQILQQQRER